MQIEANSSKYIMYSYMYVTKKIILKLKIEERQTYNALNHSSCKV